MVIIAAILACSTGVPAQPPDTVPAWFSDDSSYVLKSRGPLKRVVSVTFAAQATAADRQAVLAATGGCIVGGVRLGGDGGYYMLYVDTATSLKALKALVAKLERMPAVGHAAPVPRGVLHAH